MVKTESISSKIRNKKGCPLLPLLLNIVLEVLVRQAKKKPNRNPDWKRNKTLLTVCSILCLPVLSVHGILQARILEWVAVPFSRGSSQYRGQTLHSRQIFFLTEPPGKPNTVHRKFSKVAGYKINI